MIPIKVFSPFYDYIATAEISAGRVDLHRNEWSHKEQKVVPHPDRGRPYVQIAFFGPRGGPIDLAMFTKEQTLELIAALQSELEKLDDQTE